MLVTLSRTPDEIEIREPGYGGKPPVDRNPYDGRGGGSDDGREMGRSGPRELLHRIRFRLFLAIIVDMALLGLVVAVFYGRRIAMEMNPETAKLLGWRLMFVPNILYLNTAALLLGSLTMEVARQKIFREIDALEEWLGLGYPALQCSLPWVAATLGFGALFLAGQGQAWRQLTRQGFLFNHTSSTETYFFYLLTGMHAAHLVVGVLALLLCLTVLRFLKRVELRQIAVDATAWYWHSMGLTWLLLLGVLATGH